MNSVLSATSHAEEMELSEHVSTIGQYYREADKKILHMDNPLMTIQAGVMKNLNISPNSSVKVLKKVLIILNKADGLIIPADLMLRIQTIYTKTYAQHLELKELEVDSEERAFLLGKIVGRMKAKGLLPEHETAVFGSDRRENFLWFLGNAKIERTPTAEKKGSPIDLSDKEIIPILYCEKHEHEVRPPSETKKILAQAIIQFALMRRRMRINPQTPPNSEGGSPQVNRSGESRDDSEDVN